MRLYDLERNGKPMKIECMFGGKNKYKHLWKYYIFSWKKVCVNCGLTRDIGEKVNY